MTETEHRSDAVGVTAEPDEGAESPVATGPDARIYRVLGEQFLARPDRERVDAVGAWAREWQCTSESLPVEFEVALDRIESGAAADVETLRTAYTHLFRGVSERAPDPPYESLYMGDGFYGELAMEIRQGYRWAGFDVDDAHGNEPPDHLGLELQALGELQAMRAIQEADNPGDTDAENDDPDVEDAMWWLLEEHLTEWLPKLHARLQQEDPRDYYGGLLDLALALVKAHHRELARRR